MAPVKLVGDVSYPRYPHIRNTPAGPITEMPPLVADRFGQVMPIGWGWGLRMSSPGRVLRTIAAVNRADQPAILMVHPWELDPNPPRVRLPPRLQFAHYFRLQRISHAAARRAARNDFWPSRRRPKSITRTVNTGTRVLAATAVFCALGANAATAADVPAAAASRGGR